MQLYEMMVVRHGLMLVGQSYGMKTSAYRMLAAALTGARGAGVGERVQAAPAWARGLHPTPGRTWRGGGGSARTTGDVGTVHR